MADEESSQMPVQNDPQAEKTIALDWDGPTDPGNPQKWPKWKKIIHTVIPALYAFVLFVHLFRNPCFVSWFGLLQHRGHLHVCARATIRHAPFQYQSRSGVVACVTVHDRLHDRSPFRCSALGNVWASNPVLDKSSNADHLQCHRGCNGQSSRTHRFQVSGGSWGFGCAGCWCR